MGNNGTKLLLLPLVTGMFLLLVAVMGWIWNDTTSRIDRNTGALNTIQQEYYRIGVIETDVRWMREQLARMDAKLDKLR